MTLTAERIRGLLPYLDPAQKRELMACLAALPVKTGSFREFVASVNPRFQWYRHCNQVGDVLEGVERDEIKRALIIAPPRHGKSEEVSRLFGPYYLRKHPDRWVGLASYSAELARTLARSARTNYKGGVMTVADDAAAAHHWETGDGGGMWATGIGGPATGKGFHLGIIDDPVKSYEEAASKTIQKRNREWWESTWTTRMEPGAALIVVMTLWDPDDLGGFLLQQELMGEPEHWHIVHLPALKESPAELEALDEMLDRRWRGTLDSSSDEDFDLAREIAEETEDRLFRLGFPATCTVEPDPRAPGEVLCPERYDQAYMERLKRKSPFFFSALRQGRPRFREGKLIKRSWFEIVDAAPKEVTHDVRWWDLASTPGGGDATAGVRLLRTRKGLYYIRHIRHGHWGGDERNQIIKQTAELDGRRVRIWSGQEPGSAGKDAAASFVKMLAGYNVKTKPETGSKLVRATPFADQAEAGNVKLVRGDWNADFLDQVADFTGEDGGEDDMIDGAANAFNVIVTSKGSLAVA